MADVSFYTVSTKGNVMPKVLKAQGLDSDLQNAEVCYYCHGKAVVQEKGSFVCKNCGRKIFGTSPKKKGEIQHLRIEDNLRALLDGAKLIAPRVEIKEGADKSVAVIDIITLARQSHLSYLTVQKYLRLMNLIREYPDIWVDKAPYVKNKYYMKVRLLPKPVVQVPNIV